MTELARRLQLKDLRLILAIEETGQLQLAAERLAIAQPAASRMLASIERSLGAPVFLRHPKGMTLTPAGAILARAAINLVNGLEHALDDVEAVRTGRAGVVRVGAVTGGAVALLVPAISALKARAAAAEIYVDVEPSDSLLNGLMSGEYDFVLSRFKSGMDFRMFKLRLARSESVRFLVRGGHPLAKRRRLSLSDLAGFEWVIEGPQSPIRNAVESAFTKRGAEMPTEIINTTSVLVALTYLPLCDAIAPVSVEVAEALDPGGAEGKLTTLDVKDKISVDPYCVLSRNDRIMTPLAAQLHKLVLERTAE